jgi:phage tail-like protein
MDAGVPKHEKVVSAARFVADFPTSPMGRMAFSELGGISSKVASQEYIYNDENGHTVHTKQFGKTDPPTITLKRGVDQTGTANILAWHLLARKGDPSARVPGTLNIYALNEEEPTSRYLIEGAWLSEVSITSMKAGSSDVAMIECKITCEEIKAAPK